MTDGFRPEWLAARDRYDVAALDREAIAGVRAWAASQPRDRPLVVVDLGSGTGSAIRRALSWLDRRPLTIYAVDGDAQLLATIPDSAEPEPTPIPGHRAATPAAGRPDEVAERPAEVSGRSFGEARVVPIVADLLGPLRQSGGPGDGTVDLLLAHAVGDLLPLDRFAERVAALLRPGGIAHVALTYDGETTFEPTDDPALDLAILDRYHRHMDLGRRSDPSHGGSTAGRRLVDAVRVAGLSVVRAAPSVWNVRAGDGPVGHAVLNGLLDYVTGSLPELDGPSAADVRRWECARRAQLAAGTLRCRVRHLDVLAARPEETSVTE